MGMGRGQTAGVGGRRLANWEAEPRTDKGIQPVGQDELALLKQQAGTLADELARIRQRIEQMEKN